MAAMFLFLPTASMGGEEPAVELAGLRVVGSGYGLNGTELRAFSQSSGTSLALLVRAPGSKKIVEVDASKCSLAEFTDSSGQNLLDGVDWGGFPKVSEDGRLALVEVSSKKKPSREASKLHLKGVVHLRAAASESLEKIESLKLEAGVKAQVQQETIQVMKVQSESDGLVLVLQVSRKFKENMKDIRFITAEGKSLEIWGRGSLTFGNAAQLEYNIEAKAKPEALKVEIELWQDLEELDLAFELESGVGI